MRFFITGKGGVGKSTLAAALGLYLSSRKPTLLVSLDPTQSLATIFQQPVANQEMAVQENLFVKEMNPDFYAEEFRKDVFERLKNLRLNVGFSIRDYVEAVLANPATREEILVEYLLEELVRKDYPYLVFDMAPTASFFKTFSLMFALGNWIGFLKKQREKIAQISRVVEKQSDDPILRDLEAIYLNLKKLKEQLTDRHSAFFIVCNPGIVSAKETWNQIRFYREMKLPLKGIFFNKAVPDQTWWEFLQKAGVDFPLNEIKKIPQISFPLLKEEPIGVAHLLPLVERLRGSKMI